MKPILPPPPDRAPVPVPREIDSTALFGPHREILIRHQDECYRLQLTRNGKLILIK